MDTFPKCTGLVTAMTCQFKEKEKIDKNTTMISVSSKILGCPKPVAYGVYFAFLWRKL